MTSADDRRVGAIIGGKWRLESLLGSGSMAAVYAGIHRNGARAALKILHQALAADVAVCERFLGEGYLTNTVKHPGIVRVFDDGVTDEGCPYLVMDLLEGKTLEDFRVDRGGTLPVSETMTIIDKIMDALSAVHTAGIIHRDLKPQNIFVTTHGELKLLDFGVAKQDAQKSKSKGTMTGLVLGTPSFMSPEQALAGREPVDIKSDVWALGAIMFTLLSGETVHIAGNVSARLLAAATMKARSISTLVPSLPPDVVLVVDTALQFKKEDRWQNIDAMRAAMGHVVRSMPAVNEAALLDVVIPGLDPLMRKQMPSLPPPPIHADRASLANNSDPPPGALTEPAPPPKLTKPPSPVDLRNAPPHFDDERTMVNMTTAGPDGTLIGMSLEDVVAQPTNTSGANVGLHKGIPAAPPRPPSKSVPDGAKASNGSQPARPPALPASVRMSEANRALSTNAPASQQNRPPVPSAAQARPQAERQAPQAQGSQERGSQPAQPAQAPIAPPAQSKTQVLGGEGTGPSVRQNLPAIRASLPSYHPLPQPPQQPAPPPQRSPWPSTHNELTYPPPLDASANPTETRGPRLFVSLFAAVIAGVIAFAAVIAFRSARNNTHQPRPDDAIPTASADASATRMGPAPSSTLTLSPALAAFLDGGSRITLPTTIPTVSVSALPTYRPVPVQQGGRGPVAPTAPVTTRPPTIPTEVPTAPVPAPIW